MLGKTIFLLSSFRVGPRIILLLVTNTVRLSTDPFEIPRANFFRERIFVLQIERQNWRNIFFSQFFKFHRIAADLLNGLTVVTVSYTRSYTVSCLQLIISFYSSCTAYISSIPISRDYNHPRRPKQSLRYVRKIVCVKEKKKKWKLQSSFSISNRSRAIINGSTLSIGYVHWETQYIRKITRVQERNNIWL